MNITVDTQIGQKITDKVNEYHKKHGVCPTKVTLHIDQYRDLWITTYYGWARQIDSIHTLGRYADCDLEIGYSKEITCS